MAEPTYLVSGCMGCIGAWTLYHLHLEGKRAIGFDLSTDRGRLDLLLPHAAQESITFVHGDLTDFAQVKAALEAQNVTHIIHLAALQVPACRANPVLGAQVNVVGTVNMFEAARQLGIAHLAYASSIAVYGNAADYPYRLLPHDAPLLPRTLYGVYKQANEGTARLYWQDHALSSTGLRPFTVYGLGRDQGLTSEPTKAMQAAARGQDYHISFGGKTQMHFASDVARQFIAAAEMPLNGAHVFNLGSTPISMGEIAALIMEYAPNVRITHGDAPLPFSEGTDGTALYNAFPAHIYETPLAEGISQTIQAFARLA